LLTVKTFLPYITIGPLPFYNFQAIVTNSSSGGAIQEITAVKKLDYSVTVGGGVQFFWFASVIYSRCALLSRSR
jgi:hypothetical protein